MTTLRPDQEEAADHLAAALTLHSAAVDASDTGVGKTYTALGVARNLNRVPLVVCPKSVRSAWREVAASLDVPLLDVINVEKLRAGNTQYVTKVGKKFRWKLKNNSMIIWDEVHNASGILSQNSKILAVTKAYEYQVLMLSATIADSPLKLRAIGYLLGMHNYRDFTAWALLNGCFKHPRWDKLDFPKGSNRFRYLEDLHKRMFPEKGVRIRIDDLDVFPENAIFADAYDLDDYTDQINEIYAELEEELQKPENAANALTESLRARQKVELFKVPLLGDMTAELLDEGKSIVIFVSFRETLDRLRERFPDAAFIEGGQKDREGNIKRFQSNDARVMIATIASGGQSVSLHDLHGGHPRVSLITPTYSARELTQAIGRIFRANGKTKCIQRVVFAAGTVEEQACKAVRRKLQNINLLNDGDLTQGISI